MKKYVFIGILIIILLISGTVIYAISKGQINHTSENEIPGIEETNLEELSEDEITEEIEVKELMEETNEIPSIEVETVKQKEEPKQAVTNNQTQKQQEKTTTVQQPISTTQENPKEEKPAEVPKPTTCTTNHNHGTDVGNSNKWYSTKSEAVADYTAKVNYWSELWGNYEIDTPTYEKSCPSGYEVWSCFYCNKWTINYYYK